MAPPWWASLTVDDVISVFAQLWTGVVALGIGLFVYSQHLKKLKAKTSSSESLQLLAQRKALAEEAARKRYYEKALLRLWQSEPWKREFVGEWDMIPGSRKGFYDYVRFLGKSEATARSADAKPFGNTISCKRIDDKTLDEAWMRIDTTGGLASEGPWVNVDAEASEVVADNKKNFEKILWEEKTRSLIRTRDCPEGGYGWKQTRTIDRGVMRLSVVTTKTDGSSVQFSMALHKKTATLS